MVFKVTKWSFGKYLYFLWPHYLRECRALWCLLCGVWDDSCRPESTSLSPVRLSTAKKSFHQQAQDVKVNCHHQIKTAMFTFRYGRTTTIIMYFVVRIFIGYTALIRSAFILGYNGTKLIISSIISVHECHIQ